jgi:serine/threonine protein kinase/cytochrome c-type biogenesis protein CcmH/NrfG
VVRPGSKDYGCLMNAALFGQMAVERGFITPEQLEAALARQRAQPTQSLGQVLAALGYLGLPQVHGIEKLQLAFEKQSRDGTQEAAEGEESDQPNLTGETLGGCLILENLGVGNMGTAYRAHHLRLDRDVVVKVLHPRMVAVETYRERFAIEARAAAILEHPAIVSVYDFDSEGDYHFIVMQYVKGQDLRRVLESRGALGVRRALWIGARTLEGLAHAHGHRLIHRDIKPDNLLITPEPRIKIADFGLVRRITGTTSEEITYLGDIVGTPQYMAPEQANGLDDIDHRCDLYSLGITLFELICGRPPFEGRSAMEVMEKHILEPLPQMADLAKEEITPEVQAFVECLCAKEPADRFDSCAATLKALQTLRQSSRNTTSRLGPPAVDQADPSRDLDDTAPVVSEEALEELKNRLLRSQSFVAFEGGEGEEDGDTEEEILAPFDGLEVQSSELTMARKRLQQASSDPGRRVPDLLREMLKEGLADEMIALGKEIDAILPHSPAVAFFLAQAHERNGELEEARAKLALATAFAPDHLPARLHLARVLVSLKRVDEALQALQEACRWHPNSIKAAIRLAEVLYVVKGDAEAAIPAYERAVGLAPSRWKVRLQLAWILHEVGRSEGAVAVLEEVIAWKPGSKAANRLLARVKKKLRKAKGKAAASTDATAGEDEAELGPEGPGPRTSACLQAIRLATASKSYARALEVAESGLEKRPKSVPLLLAKAKALVKLKRLSLAVTVYGQAMAIDPKNEEANQGLIETQKLRRTARHKRQG